MESENSECNVSAVLTQMLETLSGVGHNEVGALEWHRHREELLEHSTKSRPQCATAFKALGVLGKSCSVDGCDGSVTKA